MAEDFGPNGALQGIVNEPKLEAQDKSLQQESVDWAADKMIALGVDPYTAYKYSRKILGDASSADPDNMGIGLTDFTPMGAVFALDDATRDFEGVGKKFEEGDILGGAIDAGLATGVAALSVAEAVPLTKTVTRPVKGFLRSLGGKLPQTAPSMVSGPNTAPMEKLIQLKPMTDQFGTEVPDAQKYLDSASKSPPLYDEANRGAIVAPEVDRAAEMRRQANIERFGYDPNSLDEVTEVDAGFEEYRQRVDPDGRIIPAEDRPNLAMGDMYGMLPKNAEVVKELDDGVTLHRGANGDYYATAYNPDVGEQDVVGFIQGRDNGTELAVVQEMQGRGIGSELQYLFRSENPSAPTGGLTEAGARRLEGTYERLDAEGLIIPEPPVVDKIIPEPPAADIDPQGFYSEMSRAVDALPQKKGNGSQMLAMIAKSPGVKAEEMSWTGLDDFLKGKKNVTKAEIQEYVDANQVRIEEVVKSEPDISTLNRAAMRDIEESLDAGQVLDDDALYAMESWLTATEYGNYRLARQYEALLEEKLRDAGDMRSVGDFTRSVRADYEDFSTPKFGEYTLPGGENYREVLVTVPEQPVSGARFAIKGTDGNNVSSNATTREEAIAEAGGDASRVIEIRGKDTVNTNFTGGHYGGEHPNVIAHIRLNDRTGPDGQRILFPEEFQSDIHQEAREKGYTSETVRPERRSFMLRDPETGGSVGSFETRDEADQWRATTTRDEVRDWPVVENVVPERKGLIPDLPLKKTWQEASFRRVIRMAAEEGYDSVAWTPGRIQADRYDLSSQIDRVVYHERVEGAGSLTAYKGDEIVMTKDMADSAKEMPEIIGKDAAEKLMAQEAAVSKMHPVPRRELSGQDLQVGGEGMKGFYDKIIKNYANKFGKKFGAKVGTTKIQTDANLLEHMDSLVVENEAADGFTIEGLTQRLNRVVDRVTGGQVLNFSTRAEAEQFIKNELVDTEVWNLPITKNMRDSVLKKGVPLFGAAGLVAAGQEPNEEKESF
jgi:GNAT superfamily N-acetyltransferase